MNTYCHVTPTSHDRCSVGTYGCEVKHPIEQDAVFVINPKKEAPMSEPTVVYLEKSGTYVVDGKGFCHTAEVFSNPIFEAIKYLRRVYPLGFKEAKELCDHARRYPVSDALGVAYVPYAYLEEEEPVPGDKPIIHSVSERLYQLARETEYLSPSKRVGEVYRLARATRELIADYRKTMMSIHKAISGDNPVYESIVSESEAVIEALEALTPWND